MIDVGENPAGTQVNVYQKMGIIHKLTNALDKEEVRLLKESALGKLLHLPFKPSWSRSFGLFLLCRQLENEIWVLFGGKLVRFSLREFKIVIGLRCGKFPASKKKKRKGTMAVCSGGKKM